MPSDSPGSSRHSPTRPGCGCLSLIQSAPEGEACVCDLTAPLGLSQPTVSHHLRILTEAGLLEREKRGVWAYYRLVPSAIATIADLLTPPRKRATKKALADLVSPIDPAPADPRDLLARVGAVSYGRAWSSVREATSRPGPVTLCGSPAPAPGWTVCRGPLSRG